MTSPSAPSAIARPTEVKETPSASKLSTQQLAQWIERTLEFVETLPAK